MEDAYKIVKFDEYCKKCRYEKLKDDENFKDFVEELKKSIDSEKNQIKILKERHEKITKCIAKLDKKSTIEFLSDLSDGLGLFSKME